jgi:hypothetical protein
VDHLELTDIDPFDGKIKVGDRFTISKGPGVFYPFNLFTYEVERIEGRKAHLRIVEPSRR